MYMRTIALPDARSAEVALAGDPRGFPLVLHHGTPGDATTFADWHAPCAARGLRLICMSRAGYAASTRLPGRSVAHVAGDISAVLDALGHSRFVTAGWSGGGPHALACAALLPDRVTAAASLAGVAPYEAEGLDWLAGMGEDNLVEFAAVDEGRAALEPLLESHRAAFATATGQDVREQWSTLLSPVDAEVATAELADYLVANVQAALASGVEGWVEDDLAFAEPWGFDLDAIAVPVLVWQGEEDRFVPPSHGRWLAEHVPGVDARISAEDGHLTLAEHRVPQVHAWLLEQGR